MLAWHVQIFALHTSVDATNFEFINDTQLVATSTVNKGRKPKILKQSRHKY